MPRGLAEWTLVVPVADDGSPGPEICEERTRALNYCRLPKGPRPMLQRSELCAPRGSRVQCSRDLVFFCPRSRLTEKLRIDFEAGAKSRLHPNPFSILEVADKVSGLEDTCEWPECRHGCAQFGIHKVTCREDATGPYMLHPKNIRLGTHVGMPSGLWH